MGGSSRRSSRQAKSILLFSGIVVLIMTVILKLAVRSLKVALLVLLNLPLALIGGVIAIYVTESPNIFTNTFALIGLGGHYTAPVISIASMVGFITLFGIAVRGGILLVNHYQHLVEFEGKTIYQAIVQGSSERLIPILMTALTAALAVVPIIFQGNKSGNEILAPLSVVILGGLLTSTFLNLIVVPAGYAAIYRISNSKKS